MSIKTCVYKDNLVHFGIHCRCVSPKRGPIVDFKSDRLPDVPATERHHTCDITAGTGEFGLAALGVGITKHVGWRPIKNLASDRKPSADHQKPSAGHNFGC